MSCVDQPLADGHYMVINVDGDVRRRLAEVHHRINDVVAEPNMGSSWRLTFNPDPLERDYTFTGIINRVLDAKSEAYEVRYPNDPRTPHQRFAIRAIPGSRRFVILPQHQREPWHAMNVTNVQGRYGRNVSHSPLPNIRSATADQVWLIEPLQRNQFTFSAQHVIEASADVEPEDYDQYRELVTALQEAVGKLESVDPDAAGDKSTS